jgi:uncharacterized protein (DUF608 family)
VRAIEGPIDPREYEGSHGSTVANHGLPRFRECAFAAAYPLGQVRFTDPDIPVDARLEAFNPMIPGDVDASSLPVAVFRYVLHNKSDQQLMAAVCGSMPNFIGMDGWDQERDWKGDLQPTGARENRNSFRDGRVKGILMASAGVDARSAQWGTIALACTARQGVSYRTSWPRRAWGGALLDFWRDLGDDGEHRQPADDPDDMPMASLAVRTRIPAGTTRKVTFLLCWHFPHRYAWAAKQSEEDRIGNYYTCKFRDAWEVAEEVAPQLDDLESKTVHFVRSFCESDLPDEVKEASLFNLSTLRTQTCFRTPDGRFFGWEGCGNHKGCCHGSCTHVWNYEQSLAFLYGELAMSMREVEFAHATDGDGAMSFRVNLPLERAQDFGRAAADGQMGCILKMYRDWQLSGDDERLRVLWPHVKRALQFCWIPGGWDADRDGVMEGCQHNTMDVEYYGPNPQMGFWYLAALKAGAAIADHVGDEPFAEECRRLAASGSDWIDQNLFNGEYYEHQIRLPQDASKIAPRLQVGMGAHDLSRPDFQLASGCLVDQLIGQVFAHVCGLGYLARPENVRQALRSILKYNLRDSLEDHFNNMRSFALGDEKVLLMASFPGTRPAYPFPYFPEAMTGFEYTAAIGMLQEGLVEEGLACIRNVRARYDGQRRSPFDEAECGHHYARAMIAWAASLVLTGFRFSAVEQSITFAARSGTFFWSNGYAWGTCRLQGEGHLFRTQLSVHHGQVILSEFRLRDFGVHKLAVPCTIGADQTLEVEVRRS